MAVLVSCPVCGKGASVAETQVGQTARCRQCGELIRLSPTGAPQQAHAPDRGGSARATARARATTGPAPAHSIKERGPSVTPDTPRQVGRFRVLGLLGAGAFGTVYRAHDPQLDREVALKVPQAGTLESPKAVERFLREARAAARLQHPHIVAVHDAGQDGPLYYIAAEFIQGQTLARAVEAAPFDFRAAAQVVRKLAEALAYAHRLGIVHRDVKPANVMLDAAGEPHLMDFGLAYRHGTEEKLTQDGALLGTPAYMAPEQAAGQKGQAQPASDQYALGVVLYELVCGRLPFEGPVSIVLFNVMNQEPPAPRRLRTGVPKDLETICLKAMAKKPEHRYAGCGEFADDLRRWLEGQPIRARRVGPAERLARWCRRQPLVAAALAVAVMSLIAVAVVSSVSAHLSGVAAEREGRARKEADDRRAEAEDARSKAEEEKKRSEDALEQLKKANKDKEKLKNDADDAAKKADAAKKDRDIALKGIEKAEQGQQIEADKNKQKAKEVEQKDKDLYLRNLRLAAVALGERDGKEAAAKHLDECKPELRRWEWYCLKGRCDNGETVLVGNPGPLLRITFGADGRRLAGFYKDETVKVWDVATGNEVLLKRGVRVAELSPGGTTLVVGSGEDIVFYDASSGKEVRRVRAHRRGTTRLIFNAGGTRLASTGKSASRPDDREPGDESKLLDAADGKELLAIRGGYACAFSPDGKRLAAAQGKDTMTCWEVAGPSELFSVRHTHDAALHEIIFSPDGKRLVTNGAARDKDWRGGLPGLTLWDAATGATIGDWQYCWLASFSPGGRDWVLTQKNFHGQLDADVREAARDEEMMKQLKEKNQTNVQNIWLRLPPCYVGGWTDTGQWTSSYDVRSRHTARVTSDGGRVISLVGSPRHTPGFADGEDKNTDLGVWDLSSHEKIITFDLNRYATQLVFSPDGRTLALVNERTVTLWRVGPPPEGAPPRPPGERP